MAKRTDPGADATYAALDRWRDAAWRSDGSLFTPGRAIWTTENLETLHEQIIGNPDEGGGNFMEKFHSQLRGTSDEVVQLAAELLYVHLVFLVSISSTKKREHLEAVLSWMQDSVQLPADLDRALERGIINPGQYYSTRRDLQLGYLLDAAIAWRALGREDRGLLLDDPWAFGDWARSVDPQQGVSSQRNLLLHFMHPDSFESIVSEDHKAQIAESFADLITDPDAPVDQQILEARRALEQDIGKGFEWYQPGVIERWRSDDQAWGEFIDWAARWHEGPDFDELERNYKLEAASALAEGIDAWRRGDAEWPAAIRRGFGSRHNNLTSWQAHDSFCVWLKEKPEDASRALEVLLGEGRPAGDRVGEFLDLVPPDRPKSPGARLSVASFLLMATDPTNWPVYRPTPFKAAWQLTGYASAPSTIAPGRAYDRTVGFCDQFIAEAAKRGLDLRDRLDAQSLVWAITKGDPPADWREDDRRAFLAYRGDTDESQDDEEDKDVPDDEEALRRQRYDLMKQAWLSSGVDGVPASLTEDNSIEAGRYRDALERARAAGSLQPLVDAITAVPEIQQRPPVRNFLSSLAKRVADSRHDVADVLEWFAVPASDDEAQSAIEQLGELVDELNPAGPFRRGAAGLVLGSVWSLTSPATFPVFYADAEATAKTLGWLEPPESQRHLDYWRLLRNLEPESPVVAAHCLCWAWTNFSGLDAALMHRCTENAAAAETFFEADKQYPSELAERAARNATALVGELDLTGRTLADSLSDALGRKVRRRITSHRYGADLPYRHDAYVRWEAADEDLLADLRVWITSDGIGIGLWPKWSGNDSVAAVAAALGDEVPPGFGYFTWTRAGHRAHFEATDETPTSAFLLGRWFSPEEALGRPDLGEVILETAGAARPLFDRLADGEAAPPAPTEPIDLEQEDIDHIEAAAADLLVDRDHLDRIVQALDEKGQVVLYGPPGTGKTFLARRLAQALTEGDDDRWKLVQFHPSTSYEDFFEGYRPITQEGQLHYELRPGPLARIAAQAHADPDRRYVLIIDEINRANLPKVFGELLYLLEYRDAPVQTLYRAEEEFRLPNNLSFLGTMNTADRSIGLIDAAMRRRFRFIGFFPDTEPMDLLLSRWLQENGEPEWVADIVDMVNNELADILGRHLQLGPSFFMQPGLDNQTMERIWNHSVEPFVEDQFFGDQEQIDRFSWKAVWKRYQAQIAPSPTPEPHDGDEPQHTTAEH